MSHAGLSSGQRLSTEAFYSVCTVFKSVSELPTLKNWEIFLNMDTCLPLNIMRCGQLDPASCLNTTGWSQGCRLPRFSVYSVGFLHAFYTSSSCGSSDLCSGRASCFCTKYCRGEAALDTKLERYFINILGNWRL